MDSQDPKATGANKYLLPYKTRRTIFVDNFLGGIAWSFGTFVGLAVLVIIAGFIISKINLVPIIGGWLGQILQEATSKVQFPVK